MLFLSPQVSMNIDLLMVSLAYRLNQLDRDWSVYISPQEQRWRGPFLQEALQWSIVLKLHMQDMLLEAIANDKFLPEEVHVDACNLSLTNSTVASDRDRSVSTKSITPSTFSAFSSVLSSTYSTPNILKSSFSAVEVTSQVSNQCPVIEESAREYCKSDQIPARTKMAVPSIHQHHKSHRYLGDRHRCSSLSDIDDLVTEIPLADHPAADDDNVLLFANVRSSNSLPDMLSKSFEDQKSDLFKEQHAHAHHKSSIKKQSNNSRNFDETYSKFRKGIVDHGKEQNLVTIYNRKEESDSNSERGSSTITVSSENSDLDISDSDGEHDFAFPKLRKVAVVPQDHLDNISLKEHPVEAGNDNTESPPAVCCQHVHLGQTQNEVDYNGNRTSASRGNNLSSHIGSNRSSSQMTESSPHVLLLSNRRVADSSAQLAMSSSMVDVIVILQRLINVAGTFCQNLCPVGAAQELGLMTSQSVEESSYQFQSEMSTARQELYTSLLNALCNMLCTYADNLMCLDLCGTTSGIAKRLAGPKLVEYLQTQQRSGIIWGCRHDKLRTKSCFSYLNKETEFLCDKHEPITRDMCLRINNVASMIQYLESYRRQLAESFNIMNDCQVWQHSESKDNNTIHLGDSLRYIVVDGYKYDPSVDKSSVMETISQQMPFMTSQQHQASCLVIQDCVEPCQQHLLAILRAQSRLMAYRINLFIHDALVLLLHTESNQLAISRLPSPCSGVYMDIYCPGLRIRTRENIIRGVISRKSQILIQAFSHFFKLMSNHDKGIKKDLLLSQAADITFKLQLHALPTSQVISLHRGLEQFYKEKTHVKSGLDLCSQIVVQKIRAELQQYRKCFSGARLVQWIYYNSELFETFVPDTNPGDMNKMSRKRALSIGQKLIDEGAILDMEEEQYINSEDSEVWHPPKDDADKRLSFYLCPLHFSATTEWRYITVYLFTALGPLL
ncbi:hypothetical protein ScPMuIL_001954 [Solemya velum]